MNRKGTDVHYEKCPQSVNVIHRHHQNPKKHNQLEV